MSEPTTEPTTEDPGPFADSITLNVGDTVSAQWTSRDPDASPGSVGIKITKIQLDPIMAIIGTME
jgi:hypothetical protein